MFNSPSSLSLYLDELLVLVTTYTGLHRRLLCFSFESALLFYLIAHSWIVMLNLLTVTVHACTWGALRQSRSVLLLLSLADNLLTAEPLPHGLLVAHSDLIIHLHEKVKDEGSVFRWKRLLVQNHKHRNYKPPFSQPLTYQTGNDPAGKATPLSSVMAPHHQSTPGAAAPAPCRPKETRQAVD